ncbi:hypothetical protein SDC9_193363 [bioreactor metagenome]|uniref:Uncharacterized protein n=1 Tax=bioreactor metagenome TaxID=1076179 RepID=A0A645I3D2_9ZZZZ
MNNIKIGHLQTSMIMRINQGQTGTIMRHCRYRSAIEIKHFKRIITAIAHIGQRNDGITLMTPAA